MKLGFLTIQLHDHFTFLNCFILNILIPPLFHIATAKVIYWFPNVRSTDSRCFSNFYPDDKSLSFYILVHKVDFGPEQMDTKQPK